MPDAYSIEQLTKLGPIGRSTIYTALAEGRLIARKFNRRTIVLRRDWEAFLDELPIVRAASKSRDNTIADTAA